MSTKIDWTDETWNPIKGLCPGNCWYCYARTFHKRFKWNPELRLDLQEYRVKKFKEGSKVFVCSLTDLFHHQIKQEWRTRIFQIIEKYPKLTFQILTKFPKNIGAFLLSNVWLGITLTGKIDNDNNYQRFRDFQRVWAPVKFISFEPMMSKSFYPLENIDWIIIGKLNYHGNKLQPKREWIKNYVERCRVLGIPVFLKKELKQIWGEDLIQEFPLIYHVEGLELYNLVDKNRPGAIISDITKIPNHFLGMPKKEEDKIEGPEKINMVIIPEKEEDDE